MAKRINRIEARLNDSEYVQVSNIAHKLGYSLAGFVRHRCLYDNKLVVIDRQDILQLYETLNRISSDIALIAKVAYMDDNVPTEKVDMLNYWLSEIKTTLENKLRA